MLFMTLDIVVK